MEHTLNETGKQKCYNTDCNYIIDLTTPEGRYDLGNTKNMFEMPIQFIICPRCNSKSIWERKFNARAPEDVWYIKHDLLPPDYKKERNQWLCPHKWTKRCLDDFGEVCEICGAKIDQREHIDNIEMPIVGYNPIDKEIPISPPLVIERGKGIKADPELHAYFLNKIRVGDVFSMYKRNIRDGKDQAEYEIIKCHIHRMNVEGIGYTILEKNKCGGCSWKYIKKNLYQYPFQIREDNENKQAFKRMKDVIKVGDTISFQQYYDDKKSRYVVVKGEIESISEAHPNILVLEEDGETYTVTGGAPVYCHPTWRDLEMDYIDAGTGLSKNDIKDEEAKEWFKKEFKNGYHVFLYEHKNSYSVHEYRIELISILSVNITCLNRSDHLEERLLYREFRNRFQSSNIDHNKEVDYALEEARKKREIYMKIKEKYSKGDIVFIKNKDKEIDKKKIDNIWTSNIWFADNSTCKIEIFEETLVEPLTGTRTCTHCFKERSIDNGEIDGDPRPNVEVYCRECHKCSVCNKRNHIIEYEYEDTKMFLCPFCMKSYLDLKEKRLEEDKKQLEEDEKDMKRRMAEYSNTLWT